MHLPFCKSWTPSLPLNTDIVPIQKTAASKKAILFSPANTISLTKGTEIITGQKLSDSLISPLTGLVTETGVFKGIDGITMDFINLDVQSEKTIPELKPGDYKALSTEELAALLTRLGFKTDMVPAGKTAVINVIDRDPAIAVNQQTLRENTAILKDCIGFFRKLTAAAEVIIAVTPELKNITSAHIQDAAVIQIVKADYPNGMREMLRRKLPNPDKISEIIGMEKLVAMYKSVKLGKPWQDKTVTLTVPYRKLIKNLLVKIGTPIADVLNAQDISLKEGQKLLINGTMLGTACYTPDIPVTGDTDGIYVQDKNDVIKYADTPCINCGKCTAACPVSLQINAIGRNAEYGMYDRCEKLRISQCIECGLCAYSCPAHRPLLHYVKFARQQLSEIAVRMGTK